VVGIRVQLDWRNGGSTAAKSVLSRINWHPYSDALKDTFDFRDLPSGSKETETRSFVIGPEMSVRLNATIRLDYFQRAMSGEHLYLWGWITYRDVFPNTPTRLTEFCLELANVRIGNQKPLADPEAAMQFDPIPCPGLHNCYDEDCPDYKDRTKG
jgi:hypothetical protein